MNNFIVILAAYMWCSHHNFILQHWITEKRQFVSEQFFDAIKQTAAAYLDILTHNTYSQ